MFFFFEDNNYWYSPTKITTIKPSRNYWKMYSVAEGVEPTFTKSYGKSLLDYYSTFLVQSMSLYDLTRSYKV
jgi:hypothetical protein